MVAYLNFDSEALIHNLSKIKQIVGHQRKVMAVLKANAYGHDMNWVAKICLQNNLADYFGITEIKDALALRKLNKDIPIILLHGVQSSSHIDICHKHRISLVVHSFSQLQLLKDYYALRKMKNINLWLKFDTGMGRLGFMVTDFTEVINIATQICEVDNLVLMSHLACADVVNSPHVQKQLEAFHFLAKKISCYKSISNSATIFNYHNAIYDIVRIGIAAYGVSPLSNMKDHNCFSLGLRPVMNAYAKVIAVKILPMNHSIGYGATFFCKSVTKIAIVSAGYGDGFPRNTQNAYVFLNGSLCRILGNVSMDLLCIDCSSVDVAINDSVTLWGKDLPVENLAWAAQMIPYEILTHVTNRVIKKYS